MKTITLADARQKSEEYKVTVEKMQEENIHLKTRMCEVLSNHIRPALLSEFEQFQNQFIREDEVLKLLRYNILELDNMLQTAGNRHSRLNGAVSGKMRLITDNTRQARRQLEEMKSAFNQFLVNNECC